MPKNTQRGDKIKHATRRQRKKRVESLRQPVSMDALKTLVTSLIEENVAAINFSQSNNSAESSVLSEENDNEEDNIVRRRPQRQGQKTRGYSEEALSGAVQAVQSGCSYDKASAQFKIPKTTIYNKIKGQFHKDGSRKPLMCMTGPGTALSQEMEKELEASLEMRCRLGFPINIESLRVEIVEALKEAKLPNVFEGSPNGLPSLSYVTKLVKRMSSLSVKHAQPHANGRAAVSCEALVMWYTRLKTELTERGIFDQFTDPKRVFNMDESAFFINDLKGKFICKRGATTQLRMVGSEKDNYTVGVTFSANGDLLPPFIIFKLQRPDKSVEALKKTRENLWTSYSDSGWMKSDNFLEYCKQFHGYCVQNGLLEKEDESKRVFLLVDGHLSHVGFKSSKFCETNNIVLVCLFPNSTHLAQPADVGLMAPLKKLWKRELADFRTLFKSKMSRLEFANRVLNIFTRLGDERLIMATAFRKCGLVPFNPDALDLSRLLSFHSASASAEEYVSNAEVSENSRIAITAIEDCLEPEQIVELREGKGEPALQSVYNKLSSKAGKPLETANGMSAELSFMRTEEENDGEEVPRSANSSVTSWLENLEGQWDGENGEEERVRIFTSTPINSGQEQEQRSFHTPPVGLTFVSEESETEAQVDKVGQSGSVNSDEANPDIELNAQLSVGDNSLDKSSNFDPADDIGVGTHNERFQNSQVLDPAEKQSNTPLADLQNFRRAVFSKIPNPQQRRANRRVNKARPTYILSTELHRSTLKRKGGDLDENESDEEDWRCYLCNRFWSVDQEMGLKSFWSECDSCGKTVHSNCLPKEHWNLYKPKNKRIKNFKFFCNSGCCTKVCCAV